MIRVEAILCKLLSIKSSDKQIFDTCISHMNYHNQVCPCCGSSSGLEFHSSYNRYMIAFEGGHRKEYTVSIPRLRCACGHTHALIPNSLIPYGSYSIRFILIVLYRYSLRTCSVTELCSKFQISISTLYNWISLFIKHYNLWFGVIKEICLISYKSILDIKSTPSVLTSFFKRFGFSFMQVAHLTTFYSSS